MAVVLQSACCRVIEGPPLIKQSGKDWGGGGTQVW